MDQSDQNSTPHQVLVTASSYPQFQYDTLGSGFDSDALEPVVKAPHVSSHVNPANDLSSNSNWRAAFVSTLVSLSIVLTLLVAVRFLLPPMLETARYSWYRGQLRAEHDTAGEQLKNVSLDTLSDVSALVSRRVTPTVVQIDVRQHARDSSAAVTKRSGQVIDDEEFARQFALGQGSGVVVDRSGYILTNYHVLEDAEKVEVHLADGRRVSAKIVGSDPTTDLAVLKINAPDLIAIDWGDSDKLDVGSTVWAVGSPFGLSGSITFGIISSKHRVDLSGTRYMQSANALAPRYGDLLQSDVAVNPGNSGGPLVDKNGSLVGINTAILGETYRGVSFSIPSRVAKRCYEQIRLNGKVERGWLGVELDMAAKPSILYGKPASQNETLDDVEIGTSSVQELGARVLGFAEGKSSPALRAGIRIGDRIIEFNGTQVRDANDLIRMIGETDSGIPIPLKVTRSGNELELKVKLGRRPDTLPQR